MKNNLNEDYNKRSGIYKITNVLDGRIYIGSASKLKYRFNIHKNDLEKNKHHSKKLQYFVNKYGIDKIIFELIELCDVDCLIVREQYYLDLYEPFKSNGFNHCPTAASPLGFKHSDESKEKMRQNGIGRRQTEESKIKISQANKGYKHSDEDKKRISQAGLGRVVSEETRKKIGLGNSISQIGNKMSDETKRKMSISQINRRMREHEQ